MLVVLVTLVSPWIWFPLRAIAQVPTVPAPPVLIPTDPTPTPIPTQPGREAVCAVVLQMPDAAETDEMLERLGSDRATILQDLETLRRNMEQYDAEGYGWQNIIDSPNSLDPQPGSWLLGALRMACETSQR